MESGDFKIICVDDDTDVLEVTMSLIEKFDYQCIGFSNVEEAYEYIIKNKHQVSMVLSDLRMDNINGFEFKRMLKKQANDIPFVVFTGYWTKEMSSEAMSVGVDAFIEKPVSEDVLKEQIERFASVRMGVLSEEKEMILGFLEESSPMLDEIESLILELEEQPDSEQTLSTYFRLLHTIKGTASCVGLMKLGDYTHKYEDFIGELRNKKLPVNTMTTNVLLEGLDDLKYYFEDIQEHGADNHLDINKKIEKYDPENFKAAKAESNELSAKNSQTASNTQADPSVSKNKKDEDKMVVPMTLLNNFMEESGELTVIRNSILKTVKAIEARYRGDHEIELLNDLLDGMYHVTSNIQGKITEMRKVSLKNVFRPFKRLVRDLSKQLNKEVDLEIEGEDLSVDNIVTKLFSNTLIHILRNSLDHGLESVEERENAGKDPVGKLIISVNEEGEDIVLKIVDDGKGINPKIIKSKAIEKGLYTEEELSRMSNLEIINIIFDSGFSTAEQVSDLSGRGVGMDMVRSSFEEMDGSVYVQSEVGKGSTFVLSVPIPKSVLIVNTLSVSVSKKTFIFHMDEVAEVIRYEKDSNNSTLYSVDGELILKHNSEMIQLRELSSVLELKKENNTSDIKNIVVLRIGLDRFGLIVDEIYEFEEVVSKKINDKIQNSEIYHGASLLGNGEVAMILSAEGVANKIGIEFKEKENNKFLDMSVGNTKFEEAFEEYMVFKYDYENLLCINLSKVDRLEKVAVKDIELVGNNHIIQYQGRVLPLLEPAAMIGLHDVSLKDHIEIYEKDHLEVIVVEYDSKKYGLVVYELDEIKVTPEKINLDILSDGLEGTVYINGKTLSVLDLSFLVSLYSQKKKFKIGLDAA